MAPTINWYVVYTRPKWEKKVSELLNKRQIECYCPIRKIKKQWADRKKIVLDPLFTSYVFVRVTEQQHLSVIQLDGIINFVYWLGKPAIIKDDEIDAIKNFLATYDNIGLEKVDVNINDRVRIINGPLIFEEGNVIEVNRKTVKVYLPSLGYQLTAQVEKTKIQVISKPTKRRVT